MDDATQHLWYRTQLVERLAREADHVALFPRARLAEQLRQLVGIDITADPRSYTVVPEGIDVARIRQAGVALAAPALTEMPDAAAPADIPGALADLLDRIQALPARRHGLPIVSTIRPPQKRPSSLESGRYRCSNRTWRRPS